MLGQFHSVPRSDSGILRVEWGEALHSLADCSVAVEPRYSWNCVNPKCDSMAREVRGESHDLVSRCDIRLRRILNAALHHSLIFIGWLAPRRQQRRPDPWAHRPG